MNKRSTGLSIKQKIFIRVANSRFARLSTIYLSIQSRLLKLLRMTAVLRIYDCFSEVLWYFFIKRSATKKKKSSVQNNRATVVFAFYGAGLVDNLKGITAMYQICKNVGIDFKIHIDEPFLLSDYLEPNKHDWRISTHEWNSAVKCANEITITYPSPIAPFKIQSRARNASWLTVRTNLKPYKDEYAILFEELFKPSKELEEKINYHRKKIGDSYISVSFRFQELLGDFTDSDSPAPLNSTVQKELINNCIMHLKEISEENVASGLKVLVASDSMKFKAEAQKLDFVYVVPGEIAHPAFVQTQKIEVNNDIWMGMFLDYYMIRNAAMIYLVIEGEMYNSGFPRFAAKHDGVPYVVKK